MGFNPLLPWRYKILTSSFIIFTMQTGFGLLECGCVTMKNESNIMMKNVVDVVFGGLTYWIFGFSLSYGEDKGSTPFAGVGHYAVDSKYELMGSVFSTFLFQLSFATTATTIVSGAMAERCNFKAYCVFSMLNTIVYCVPARWIWGHHGFLKSLGCIDIAGAGGVHLLGGASGLMAAKMLGPRLGRYENGTASLPLGNPVSCVAGLYVLWWGWLVFNSGSTFGVSDGKYAFASRAAVTTFIASVGGGLIGSAWTLSKSSRIFQCMDIINPVLGALVGVTGGCALYHTFDAFVVGIVGGIVVILTSPVADKFRIDDPVGAVPVHMFGGMWGLLSVGLFAEHDGGMEFSGENAGVFRGGTLYLLCVQMLACVCIITWAFFITFVLLWLINRLVPIRMDPHEELLGADLTEHLVRRRYIGITPVMSALRHHHPSLTGMQEQSAVIGNSNPVHDPIVKALGNMGKSSRWGTLRKATLAMLWIPRSARVQSRPRSDTESSGNQSDSRQISLKDTLRYLDYDYDIEVVGEDNIQKSSKKNPVLQRKNPEMIIKDVLGETSASGRY